jgi:hypothetical protein
MHAVDFLYRYATSAMDDELLAASFLPRDEILVCACCGRLSSAWYRPEAVRSVIYRQPVAHCLPCYALFHGSKKYLGIERTAKSLEGARAIPGKLGMLATCALLVTTEKVIIFTGENYAQKIAQAQAPFFSLRRATGIAQIVALLEINPQPPFLFISDLGRRKEPLVANLRVTAQKESWYLCSADKTETLHPNVLANLIDAIERSAMPADLISQWLSSLWRVATGGMAADDSSIIELSECLPDFRRRILPLFPHDPYQRIDCVRLVQTWMEAQRDRV